MSKKICKIHKEYMVTDKNGGFVNISIYDTRKIYGTSLEITLSRKDYELLASEILKIELQKRKRDDINMHGYGPNMDPNKLHFKEAAEEAARRG